MSATWLWPLWQAIVLSIGWGFTQRGKQRFVQWVTVLALQRPGARRHPVARRPGPTTGRPWSRPPGAAAGTCPPSGGVARRLDRLPNRAWHGYSVWAGADSKVHRNSKEVWGTCTFHEYTPRRPNRASTARAHNWVGLGVLGPNRGQPAHFLFASNA